MTNTNDLSYNQYCNQLLDSMVSNIIYNLVSSQLLQEKLLRKEYGTITNPKFHNQISKANSDPDIGRFEIKLNGKDVYLNAMNDNTAILGDKLSQITTGTAQDTYFKCSNCDRKIAGSRFAAHIDKCLGGRSRK